MIDFTHRQISVSDIDRAADCIGNNEKTRECELRQTIYGTFPYDYKIENLKDLCVTQGGIQTGPFGSQLHQEDYVDVGTPILTVEHLGENRITHNNIPRISNADRCRLAKYSLESGDIVFSRVGSVDRRALVRPAEEGWLFSGRCLRVRPDQKKLDSGYLSYFFGLDSFKKYIRSVAVGATMPSLNTAILSDIEIPHPKSLPEQRRIAHVLGTLDDKIENNRKTAKTLEAMAQAIFQSWFVDFDPVRAKMAGESRESICKRLKLTPEILDLFPDRLVDSELGEIPEGWVISPVSEIVEFNPTMPIKKDIAAPYLDMASLPTVGSWPADPIFRPYSSGMKFQNGDTLLARITPCLENGKTAYIQCLKDHGVGWGSTEFIVMRPKPPVPSVVAYLIARNDKFRAHAIQSMTGTSGRQRAQVTTILDFLVVQPDKASLWPLFGRISVPFFDNIKSLYKENMVLIKLLDVLLPKLISGETRVPEAEHFMETDKHKLEL